jgi:hypothetical protein
MRMVQVFAFVAFGTFFTGCTTSRPSLVLERVGPGPVQPANSQKGPDGSLVVFSAVDVGAHFNTVPYRPIYSDYQIQTKDGNPLRNVTNRDTRRNSPNPVALPAGEYRVLARANSYGLVTVPVLIVAGQTTTVHLEGPSSWADSDSAERFNYVCLAHGQIVGYRADKTPP